MTHTVGKSLIIKDAQQDIVNQWGSAGKHLQLDFIDALCLFFPKTRRQLFCIQNLKLDFIRNNILLAISASGNVWLFLLLFKTSFLFIISRFLHSSLSQIANTLLGGTRLKWIFTDRNCTNLESWKCNPYSCCWMFIKSNNSIKIYHDPWVNSPNREEQLRDTEGMFHSKEIT